MSLTLDWELGMGKRRSESYKGLLLGVEWFSISNFQLDLPRLIPMLNSVNVRGLSVSQFSQCYFSIMSSSDLLWPDLTWPHLIIPQHTWPMPKQNPNNAHKISMQCSCLDNGHTESGNLSNWESTPKKNVKIEIDFCENVIGNLPKNFELELNVKSMPRPHTRPNSLCVSVSLCKFLN